jgi:hypothetical protein
MLKTAAILKWNMDAYICQDVYIFLHFFILFIRKCFAVYQFFYTLALFISEFNKARIVSIFVVPIPPLSPES